MERMMKVLKQTFEDIEGAVKPQDLAQGAEEILLEPRVLLSLPSSSSLLQTWLACAVIEIHKASLAYRVVSIILIPFKIYLGVTTVDIP
jgi:predicted Zn-dependent peptidase